MKTIIAAVLCLGLTAFASETADKFEYNAEGLKAEKFDTAAILDMHTHRVKRFAGTEGMGISRMSSDGLYPKLTRTDDSAVETYKLSTQELVGIAMQKEPQAFVGNFAMATFKTMEVLKNKKVEFRELDAFEKDAVAKLKAGGDLVAVEEAGKLRVVGAIRATNSCLVCHGAEEKELLGAFAYTFVAMPKLKPVQKQIKPQTPPPVKQQIEQF